MHPVSPLGALLRGLESGSSSSPAWVSARCPVASSLKIVEVLSLFSQATTATHQIA
jgi:hypothetical protein